MDQDYPLFGVLLCGAAVIAYFLKDAFARVFKRAPILSSPPPNQVRAASFHEEHLWELFRHATYFAIVTVFLVAVRRVVAFDISFLAGSLLGNWLAKPIQSMATSAGILSVPSLVSVHLSHALSLRKFYESYRKHDFTVSMKMFYEALVKKYVRYITMWNWNCDPMRVILEEVMRLPVALKPVSVDKAAFRKFIRSYPEQVQHEVASFLVDIVKTSNGQDTAKAKRKAIPLMMVGPPGTGKTYLANRIGKFTGLPVKAINLSKYKKSLRLDGEDATWQYNPNRGLVADILLDLCGKDDNYANKIVILDEVDKGLHTDNCGSLGNDCDNLLCFLLEILEQSTTEMSMRRYDYSYHDISNLKIILIANKTFREAVGDDHARPLENRVKVIKFDRGYSKENKRAIIESHMDRILRERDVSELLVDEEVIDEILNVDESLGNKGVRICLSVVEDYVSQLANSADISDLIDDCPPFHVGNRFSCYEAPTEKPAQGRRSLDKKGKHREDRLCPSDAEQEEGPEILKVI